MIAVRRSSRAFGRGTLRFLYPQNRKVLVYLREQDGERGQWREASGGAGEPGEQALALGGGADQQQAGDEREGRPGLGEGVPQNSDIPGATPTSTKRGPSASIASASSVRRSSIPSVRTDGTP